MRLPSRTIALILLGPPLRKAAIYKEYASREVFRILSLGQTCLMPIIG